LWAVIAVLFSWNRAGAATDDSAATNRIVVMISVDGLAAFYFDDPKAEMPAIHELAENGVRSTMMKASTPTVTWPNHTTLVTGVTPAKHGVVGNNYFDRATGKRVALISDPVYDKDQIVKVPTIYDLAKAQGLKTAAIRWPATRNAKTLDWTIPDMKVEAGVKFSTPALLEECRAAGLDYATGATNAEAADELSTRIFNFILHTHRPNLALLHIANVDHTQHLNGPRTPEAYAAVKAADRQVREVWEELQRDFPGEATLVIVSDHGFSPINHTILPNVVLRQAGLLTVAGKETTGPVHVVVQGGCAMVYVLDEAHRTELLSRVCRAFTGIMGVSKIVGPEQLKEYGVANPKDDPHAPDLILFADEGWSFGDTAAGALPTKEKQELTGTHGHDPNLPHLHATFVAWGAGIQPGVQLGEISNTSVAPTLAQLLHLTLPDADGPTLTAALVP
jgi:predicted AlkP superfamily pyrophosphatase or phosphodiesterase